MISVQNQDSHGDDHRRSPGFFNRYPSQFWRCLFVGITYAMPGTIAGMLIALFLPYSWTPVSPVCITLGGTTLGFMAGVLIEKD